MDKIKLSEAEFINLYEVNEKELATYSASSTCHMCHGCRERNRESNNE